MTTGLIHPDALSDIGWNQAVPCEASQFCALANLSMRTILYLGLTYPAPRTVGQIQVACHMLSGTIYATLGRMVRAGILRPHSAPGYKIVQLYSFVPQAERPPGRVE